MRAYTKSEKRGIIDALAPIVAKHVKHFAEDFSIDRETIEAKTNKLPMIWIARTCGTNLVSFQDAETWTAEDLAGYTEAAAKTVTWYGENTPREIQIYRIERGEVHRVRDYRKAVELIRRTGESLAPVI